MIVVTLETTIVYLVSSATNTFTFILFVHLFSAANVVIHDVASHAFEYLSRFGKQDCRSPKGLLAPHNGTVLGKRLPPD